MLFEPYSRTGLLKQLDDDFRAVGGPAAHFPSTCRHNRVRFSWVLALGGSILLALSSVATAQSAAVAPARASGRPTKTVTKHPPGHHAVHHRRHAKPEAAAATVAAAPPPSLPPAEQPANPATIDFNHGLLSVRAQNSSLVSILVQIQHQTGLVIDGLSHDQRIYGQYGPGSISTTLSALLDGSGYDFVIVGNGSSHAAPRLILSTPGSAGAVTSPTPVAGNQAAPPEQNNPDATQPDDNQDATPPDGDQADPTAPPQAKSPQEIFDELRRMHPQ